MPPTEVVLEVLRLGRRPRYHRGARLDNGQVTGVEQCNLDGVAWEVRQLDRLPDLRRPWTQLCRRCWRGTEVLAAALELGAAAALRAAALATQQATNRAALFARLDAPQ